LPSWSIVRKYFYAQFTIEAPNEIQSSFFVRRGGQSMPRMEYPARKINSDYFSFGDGYIFLCVFSARNYRAHLRSGHSLSAAHKQQ
jgi:hypothetical protein